MAAIKVPDSIKLNYTIHIEFLKIGENRYIPHRYYATGNSPWQWGANKESRQGICTTAVRLGSKVVTNEKELNYVVDQLVTAAESCCKPDLFLNRKPVYAKVKNLAEKSKAISLDWSAKV